MRHNGCVFCAREIPDHQLACDRCRPLVKKLDRKRRRTFEREENRLKNLAELQASIERLKKESRHITEQIIEYLREWVEKAKKKEEQSHGGDT